MVKNGCNPGSTKDLTLDEIADWKVNCPDAGEPRVRLHSSSMGFNWDAQKVEKLWTDILTGVPMSPFILKYEGELPELVDGEQRATAIALGFYNPWDKNADSWENMQGEGMRRHASQIEGPAGVLWIDLAAPSGGEYKNDFVMRLVTHKDPWGFLRNREGELPQTGQKLALENFLRVIRCQKEIPDNENLPGWASGDTIPLAWAWPWDAITPMPFSLLCELAGIRTPEWEEFLLFSIENNPIWQLDCPMPTASTHCWKEKICQLLKHRQGEDYEHLKRIVKIMPKVIARRIPVEVDA